MADAPAVTAAARLVDELPPVTELRGVDRARFDNDIATGDRPVVLRGLVAEWPAVRAASSPQGIHDYLVPLALPVPVNAFLGEPEIEGRYFYRPDGEGLNFATVKTSLDKLLGALLAIDKGGDRQAVYMGSTPTPQILPAFARDNRLDLVVGRPTEPRIWIGNSSRIAPHFDESDNIACVVSGKRRFVLFPPEQVANLYIGPIDRTVAGQPTSMVDLAAPDLERFPKFEQALASATVAFLEPGDAIFIPSLWWHGVESTGPVNILVNYWWSDTPAGSGSGLHALGHGLLTLSHLPESKRRAWRAMFDHFVFQLDGDPAEHIPPAARGILGRTSPEVRQAIRQYLIRALQSL
jgi:hypothetical protein